LKIQEKAYLKLERNDKYPYVINRLIRTLNEKGLENLRGIQTKILEITDNGCNVEHMFLAWIIDIEIEDNSEDALFITYGSQGKPYEPFGRWCLKFDAIIGWLEK